MAKSELLLTNVIPAALDALSRLIYNGTDMSALRLLGIMTN
jgi:hypothetical protein